MTEYLVFHNDKWHIAYPGAIEDDTEECVNCNGSGVVMHNTLRMTCGMCRGSRRRQTNDRVVRLAWFERNHHMLCFDYSQPDVKRLPE